MANNQRALLIDLVECVGCYQCVKNCMEIHGFAGNPAEVKELHASAYTLLAEGPGVSIRNLCRHCIKPSCVSVCPVGALQKTDLGPVVYEGERCIGCRYCMVACPFDIPRYEWDKAVPSVKKCDMCIDRLRKGEEPACAAVCGAEATLAGTRDELLQVAYERIRENPDAYGAHVFGEHEVGGTLVMFLAPKLVTPHGFHRHLGTAPLPALTWRVLNMIPGVVVTGGAMLTGLWWLTRRRDEVAWAESRALIESQAKHDKERRGDGNNDA